MKNAILLVFASILLSTTLVLGLVRPATAQEPIHIERDVDPPTDKIQRDGTIFTLTDDINNFIVVESDGIVLDGADHALLGTGSGTGINLTGRRDVTIRNLVIEDFTYGIYLLNSNNNIISGNTIEDNDDGIYLNQTSDNSVSGNTVISNAIGITLSNSLHNTISGHNKVTFNDLGIYFKYSSSNNVSGNTIEDNVATGPIGDGIRLFHSSNNSLSENTITRNKYAGIHLDFSDHNIVINNTVLNNKYGIRVVNSINCNFHKNDISDNNPIGIFLSSRPSAINNFTLVENYISNNDVGLWIWRSSAVVHHNMFLNNSVQVSLHESYNTTWDNGSEGNYWDNYHGNDMDKNEIGDEPYDIDERNQDKYPLMAKAIIPPPFWTEWWFWAACALAVAMVFLFRKYTQRSRTVKAYKRQVETGGLLFKEDIQRRRQKIEEFEKKYGIRIRRLEDDLEDLLERMGIKKRKE